MVIDKPDPPLIGGVFIQNEFGDGNRCECGIADLIEYDSPIILTNNLPVRFSMEIAGIWIIKGIGYQPGGDINQLFIKR